MGMTDKSLCNSCTNIGCEFQSGIVRMKCAFYMPPQLEPDNCGNYVVQDSTTKNDIRDNRVKNELNRVKDELEPTTKNCESCRYYVSHHEVCNYCYKCSLWTKKELTTKNDLGVDWESYKDVDGNSLDDLILEVLQNNFDCGNTYGYKVADEIIGLLPSVTPQESILDKIRAEIEEAQTYDGIYIDRAYVLEIIDKYKAESEGKE